MKQLVFLFLLPLTVSSQTIDPAVQSKIIAVENSLAPTIIFGDTVPKLNIEKRMAATAIQGLSIAVIRNYKIEWAKGYGWADVEEKRVCFFVGSREMMRLTSWTNPISSILSASSNTKCLISLRLTCPC